MVLPRCVPSLRSYLDPQAWFQTNDHRRSHGTHRRRDPTSAQVADRRLRGPVIGSRSAHIQHPMAVTPVRPGARPFHTAVTSRLIAIAHRARVHACLLKTSLEHTSLCLCVSAVRQREQARVYRSQLQTVRKFLVTVPPLRASMWRTTPPDGSATAVFQPAVPVDAIVIMIASSLKSRCVIQ